jgi:hypothetical protein
VRESFSHQLRFANQELILQPLFQCGARVIALSTGSEDKHIEHMQIVRPDRQIGMGIGLFRHNLDDRYRCDVKMSLSLGQLRWHPPIAPCMTRSRDQNDRPFLSRLLNGVRHCAIAGPLNQSHPGQRLSRYQFAMCHKQHFI